MTTMEDANTIKEVQIEALTVVKIVKHCATRAPATATGFIAGMDQANGCLEATNAFPFPVVDLPPDAQQYEQNFNSAAAAPRAKSNTSYQAEMIRMQKEVNVDANCVGWYTSANMGNFINSNFVENQFYYQKEANERTVALVHDTSRSSQGGLSLRAFRLSAQFMTVYKEGSFTTEKLQKSGLKYTDILVEIPVRLHNSHLVTTFLNQIPSSLLNRNTIDASSTSSTTLPAPSSIKSLENHPAIMTDTLAPTFDSLSLSIDPFLASTCDSLLDSIESHHVEANNFSYYSRALAREQAKIAQWQAKRKAENAQRAISKQPALPEDEWQKLFKLPQEPSRLDSMLNSRQVDHYARQVDGFVAGTTGKMFAVRGNLIPGDLNIPLADE